MIHLVNNRFWDINSALNYHCIKDDRAWIIEAETFFLNYRIFQCCAKLMALSLASSDRSLLHTKVGHYSQSSRARSPKPAWPPRAWKRSYPLKLKTNSFYNKCRFRNRNFRSLSRYLFANHVVMYPINRSFKWGLTSWRPWTK